MVNHLLFNNIESTSNVTIMDFEDNDAFEDDLDVLEIIEIGFPRAVYVRHNYMDTMSDFEFFKRFRLKKGTVNELLILIEPQLEFPYDTNNAVAPINQLLIALRFYATGQHLLSVGDFAGVHISTVSRIIKKVSEAIASLLPHFIKFPNTHEERSQVQREFYNISAFPKVIGAVDCTHIKIQSPGGNDAEVFRNRKMYFSINVQAISDARNKFLHIVARWPGSAHDQTIFNNSSVRAFLENQRFQNGVLLGDSAYNLKTYLLTPIQAPHGNAEQLYNEAHIRTRGSVEKLFGIWKRRFPVLCYGSRLKVQTTLVVIIATAVLHNIARDMNEEEPPLDQELILNVNEGDILILPQNDPQHINQGRNVRQQFIDYFHRL